MGDIKDICESKLDLLKHSQLLLIFLIWLKDGYQ